MYAIRIRPHNEPLWFQDGKEIQYVTEREAEQALIEEMEECAQACSLGYMEDEGDWDDYIIVKVLANE